MKTLSALLALSEQKLTGHRWIPITKGSKGGGGGGSDGFFVASLKSFWWNSRVVDFGRYDTHVTPL